MTRAGGIPVVHGGEDVNTCRHQLGCEEPAWPRPDGPLPEPAAGIGDWGDWPWSLLDYLPSAARAAGGRPSLVIWHFRQPAA